MDPSERNKLFDRILMENARLIHDMAGRYASAALARDLEQEILLALWKSLDRFEGRSSLTTWVYAVALNTARYFNRKNRRPETIVGHMDPKPATTANYDAQRDPDDILEEFMGSLETRDRETFDMYLDRLSYREMSEILEINEASLRMRVSRLKQRFTSTYIGTGK
jgi:RNA polymerase sigma-70 factor (ECF subfamily)